MEAMVLQEFHKRLGAEFRMVNGARAVAHYGNMLGEHKALCESAGVLDLSFRGRLCLTGADRVRFLHGQVTNDVKGLGAGRGCYAAVVNAKGRMEADLNVLCLPEELLLDFEPGLTQALTERLERYVVADDVQVVDVSALYGLLSVQGPKAESVVRGLNLIGELPSAAFHLASSLKEPWGEVYVVNQPRLGTKGFELYVPVAALPEVAAQLLESARAEGGCAAGWDPFDIARVERGIPRFGPDMGEKNFPQECGIESRVMSYSKGCYIGQEVLNRLHTMGHVNRILRVLQLGPGAPPPVANDLIISDDKETGHVTSAVASPRFGTAIALGFVRREAQAIGTEVLLRTAEGDVAARILAAPFGEEPQP
jgi:folate-binding protein YgfZ